MFKLIACLAVVLYGRANATPQNQADAALRGEASLDEFGASLVEVDAAQVLPFSDFAINPILPKTGSSQSIQSFHRLAVRNQSNPSTDWQHHPRSDDFISLGQNRGASRPGASLGQNREATGADVRPDYQCG